MSASILNRACWAMLKKHPSRAMMYLKTRHTLIGSNAISVNAMLQAAKNLGYETKLYSDHLCGEARTVGAPHRRCVRRATTKSRRFRRNHPTKQTHGPVGGRRNHGHRKGNGLGGRDQEMALAFAIAAEQQGLTGNWAFLSGGTDGRDGPADAAGGIVDRDTIKRMTQAGVNPIELLENNDSYTALKTSDDLVNTGATGPMSPISKYC